MKWRLVLSLYCSFLKQTNKKEIASILQRDICALHKAEIAELCEKLDNLEAAKQISLETADLDECEALQEIITTVKMRVLQLEHLAIIETCASMIETLQTNKAKLEQEKQVNNTYEGCTQLQRQIDDLQARSTFSNKTCECDVKEIIFSSISPGKNLRSRGVVSHPRARTRSQSYCPPIGDICLLALMLIPTVDGDG